MSGMQDEKWEVRVIDAPDEINAFVMPGGKVFVFSGILRVCRDDEGLAAVLGHEISHNVAHHIGEKLTRNIWIGVLALAAGLIFDTSLQTSHTLLNLVLSLPNSRTAEVCIVSLFHGYLLRAIQSEADYIGLCTNAMSISY